MCSTCRAVASALIIAAAAAATTLGAGAAEGKTAPAATPAPDRGPDLSTATYGDWQLRCGLANTAAGQPDQRNCEVIQNIVVQGQSQPFAQIGFGKLAPDQPLYFTAVVPVNVSFPSAVEIATGTDDKRPVELDFTRCLPQGCFASVELTDDVLKRWRAASGPGSMSFKSGQGQNLRVPISFRGLDRALSAFEKQD